jgi:DNA excision repair protein ERCC-2
MHKRRRGISIGAKTRASPSLDPGVSARLWYPTGGFNAETRWSMHHFVRLEPGAIPALKPQLSIAVRTLAEHVLRCGDLRVAFLGPRRAQAGIAGHRKIQESRPAGYQPEVPVAGRVETDRFVLRIAGRIDGVWPRDDGLVVEEIKTTTRSLDAAADNPVHWGQAKIYAHLMAVERKLEMATVQLTYLHLASGEVLEIPRSFTAAELESFFDTVVGRYLQWAAAMIDWRIRRDESIRKLDFPFSAYRPGQREMAVAVYRAVRDNHPLLVQAPTGIGKTLAVWFPSVKAMGEGLVDRVFYLTARTTGRAGGPGRPVPSAGSRLALSHLEPHGQGQDLFSPRGRMQRQALRIRQRPLRPAQRCPGGGHKHRGPHPWRPGGRGPNPPGLPFRPRHDLGPLGRRHHL